MISEVDLQVQRTLQALNGEFSSSSMKPIEWCISLIEGEAVSTLESEVEKLQLGLDVVSFKLIQECTENSARLLQALQQDEQIIGTLNGMKDDLFAILSALDAICAEYCEKVSERRELEKEIANSEASLQNLSLWEHAMEVEGKFIHAGDLFEAYDLYREFMLINHKIGIEKDTRQMEKMLFSLYMQEVEKNLCCLQPETLEKIGEIFVLQAEELEQLVGAFVYKLLLSQSKVEVNLSFEFIEKLLSNLVCIHRTFSWFITEKTLRKVVNEQVFGEFLLVKLEVTLNCNVSLQECIQIAERIEKFKKLYEKFLVQPDSQFECKLAACLDAFTRKMHFKAQNSIRECAFEELYTHFNVVFDAFTKVNDAMPLATCKIEWKKEALLFAGQLESLLTKEWNAQLAETFFTCLKSPLIEGFLQLKPLAFDKLMKKDEIFAQFFLLNWASSGTMDRHHSFVDSIISNVNEFQSTFTPSSNSHLKQELLEHICNCLVDWSCQVNRFTHETRAILMLDLKVLSEYFQLPCPPLAEAFVKSFYFSPEQMEQWILNNFDKIPRKNLFGALTANNSLEPKFVEKMKAFLEYKQ